jgi:predicted DNA-binding transcriptional regulator YafY
VNRIDRLFAITTQLQARGRLRAADLAAHFEVSQRTIYRDIGALSESGIPIVSLPGQGYTLAEGFFLPPLILSQREAVAVVLGARLLASHGSAEIASAADDGVAKIVAVMGEDARRELAELDGAIDVAAAPSFADRLDLNDRRVESLRRAILERRLVTLRYFGRNRGEETMRQVEPRRLSYADGAWYLTAFCRSRQDERAFRLDRIEAFQVEPERFRPRPAATGVTAPAVEVEVRFRADVVRWVSEKQHWSFTGETPSAGGTLMRYRPGNIDEIASWLLGWGAAAKVLTPLELRDRLRREALAVAEMLT